MPDDPAALRRELDEAHDRAFAGIRELPWVDLADLDRLRRMVPTRRR